MLNLNYNIDKIDNFKLTLLQWFNQILIYLKI